MSRIPPARGILRLSLPMLVLLAAVRPGEAQSVDTIVGNIPLVDNTEARKIPLVAPRGLALDPGARWLYVSDDGSAAVRRISLASPQSTIVAGTGKLIDDLIPIPARAANLNFALGLAVDHSGNLLIVDDAHNRVRKLTADGKLTTIIGNGTPGFSGDGGPALRAQLRFPKGIAVDNDDNIYIADTFNGAIRRVDRATGIITTIVGGSGKTAQGNDIPAQTALLRQPFGITVSGSGDIYFTDNADHVAYRLDKTTGLLRRIAGQPTLPGVAGDRGPALRARLQEPRGIAVAANGDVYIGMLTLLRKVTAATGIITTVLGNTTGFAPLLEDVPGNLTYIPGSIEQLVLDEPSSTLFVSLTGASLVGRIDLRSSQFTILAGDTTQVGDRGPALNGALFQPNKMALAADGTLYVADSNHHRIRRIAPGPGGVGTGNITTAVGNGMVSFAPTFGAPESIAIGFPRGVAIGPDGSLYFTTGTNLIRRLDSRGNIDTVAGTPATGFTGDGVLATSTSLNDPWALAFDPAGNLYIADAGNHRIRKVSPGGFISTVAGTGVAGFLGDGGQGTVARLSLPIEVRVDPQGQNLYIADNGNRRVRKLSLTTGIISTVFADLNPRGMWFDPQGRLVIADQNRIYRLNLASNQSEVLVGDGAAGFTGDGGLATLARVSAVFGVLVDPAGNILFTDATNNRIRRISALADPPQLTLAPSRMQFATSLGGAAPADQTITIGTAAQTLTGWTAALRSQPGTNWLKLRTPAGATPAVIQVGADPAGLSVGEYTGSIVISSPGATNSPLTLDVSLTISAPQPAALDVGPQLLTFQGIAGEASPAAKSFTISNRGGGTLEWSVLPLTNSGGNWLTASPSSGRGTGIVNIAPATASLSPGLYEAQVRVTNTATGRVEIVTISLNVDRATPAMLLSQTGVVFTATAGSTSIPLESFRVVNSGAGVLNWRARVTPLSGGEWLALSADSGSTTGGNSSTVSLQASSQVDSNNLEPGIYDSLVELSADGARNSPQLVLARLRVLDPDEPPVPTVRPGSIVLVATEGSAQPQSSSVTLSSSGGTNLNYQSATRTTDGADWLTATPASGPLTGSADQANVTISAKAEKLQAGYYSGQVSFSFSNGTTQEAGVLLVVTPAAAAVSSNAGSGKSGPASGVELGLPSSAACEPVSQRPWVVSLTNNVPTPTAFPVGIRAAVVDNCGNLVSRSSVIAAVASGTNADRVALQPLGEGQYAANYTLDRTGNYLIVINASGSGLLAGASDPISANSAALPPSQATPGVSAIGAIDGASFRQFSTLAPGQIISVSGNSLASAPTEAPTLPLPTELGGVKISIGGHSLPLYYSSPDEMNAQVPFELAPGSDLPLVIIARGNASPPQMVRIGRTSPGLFTQNQTGQGLGMVSDTQGRPITPANPARRGGEVIAYGTGFGLTEPPVGSGQVSPASPVARTALPVRAFIGGNSVAATFAGLAPGFVGLYQINFQIPADAPTGDAVELYLEQDNNTSNRVTMAIQ